MNRQMNLVVSTLLLSLLLTAALPAQTGIITTIAGTGQSGSTGIGGPAVNAPIVPAGICLDSAENIYVVDAGNNRVVRIDAASGILTLVAGNGTAASSGDNGPAAQASLNAPRGVAIDSAGNVFISEFLGNRIRRVDAATGIITTFAGTGTAGFSGDGGPAASAAVGLPFGIALDAAQNLYIADMGNVRVRRVDAQTGIITTVAGNGSSGFTPDGSPALGGSFTVPFAISFDRSGNLLIGEYNNARLRRVDSSTGLVSTVAGNGSTTFTGDGIPASGAGIGKVAYGVASDSAGNMYFPDGTGRIRRVFASTGVITTVAGNGSGAQGQSASGGGGGGPVCYSTPSGDNGPATSATLDGAYAVAVTANGNLLITDAMDCRIRRVFLPSPFTYTNTTLAATSTNPTQGQPLTFTATVSPIGSGGAPGGSVQFVDQPQFLGTTVLGTVPLNGGIATLTTTSLSSSSPHLIVAYYTGDSLSNASGSPPVTVTVAPPASKLSPIIDLQADHLTTTLNTTVTFTCTVSIPYGGTAMPTGSVVLYDGTTPIQTATLVNGVALFPVSFTTTGSHMIRSIYQGDSNYSWVSNGGIFETVKSSVTVALTANNNPSTAGTAVTFTATITPSNATGYVQFTDGAAFLGIGNLSNGVATLTTANLTAGSHSILGSYSGDSSYIATNSPILAQTVKAATTMSVTSSAPSATFGQTVTLTASVTPTSATGTVQFMDGAMPLGSASLSTGTAAITIATLTAGSHSITAVYSGDSANGGSTSASFAQSVAQATPAITLTSATNPATVGQTVSFSASIAPVSPGAALSILDGQAVLATVSVSNGTASYSTAALGAGTHSITVTWAGDANVAAGTSAVLTQTVQSPTTLSLTAPGPLTYGQSVTFTAAISPAAATGSVQFTDGGTALGTAALSGGHASITVPSLNVGNHQVTASYTTDGIYLNSTVTTSIDVAKAAATATLAATPNPSTTGQTVTLTATVSPNAATGTVQFLDGATVLGTATLTSGSATFSTSALTAGSHSITAVYSGDGNYNAATSPVVSQMVKQDTTTAVSTPVNPSPEGLSLTFYATVLPANTTGTVQFLDGNTVLGTATTAFGSASLNFSGLTAGSHNITAIYSGDGSFNASTSPAWVQVVKLATSTTIGTNQPAPAFGQTVDLMAYITPAAATGSVQFYDASTLIATVAVANGGATFSTSALSVGAHGISAIYVGDATYARSGSAPLTITVSKAGTTATLGSSLNPSLTGQPVTFTATVSPAAATGTVQFSDGATALGTVALSGGSAAFSTSALSAGAHSITASYSGDGNYSGSSGALTQTVKATSATTLSASSTTPTVGQAVTLTASIAPATATGTVQFLDGATLLGTSTISGGSAALSISTLTVGAHSITTIYSGDTNDNGSTSSAVTVTVGKTPSATTLSASSTTPTVGQAVTLTASIAPTTATGTVQFLDGATLLGTSAVSGGSAALSISTLTVGAHSITAIYSGDTNDNGSTSSAVTVTVAKAASSVALASSLNPSVAGQSVTFTATVSPSAATGTVQFNDGATVLGTVTLSGGSAAFNTSALAAGAHSITAAYSGDGTYNGSSAGLSQTVKATSTATLSASSTSPTVGQVVNLTASITPATATGTVQFLDGATVLGTLAVSGGSAVLSVSTLAVGAHSISAVYSGDANDTGSTSGAVTVTVGKITSTTAVTSSLNPSVSGQSVTFTATVSPSSSTGTVQFKDGSTVLGTVTLTSGSAGFSTSTLAVGSHSITAVYGGDANTNGSTSAVLTQSVSAPPPGAPSNLTATAANSSTINLAWTASPTSGVTYNVYSSANAIFTPSASNRIASGLTTTSYSNTGLAGATTRYYVVTAQNANGESAASNMASATTKGSGLSCHVGYSVTTQWNVGFGTAITIQNTGNTPINGWTLTWTWAGNQQITQSWNSNYSQTGANATLTNMSYNPTIAAGATLSGMGFNASYSGTNTAPTAFYVNGTKCN